ncbi:MAG: hypothetical protein HY303_16685 [Candidatus Wallbacteria bacterium]|nr:hypothetical protein [Candidatus Wallbacteria bacterium]
MLRLTLALALFLAVACPAADFLPVSEIKPGMKGHGLTVFSGTEPERFEAEAVAVLKNALPGQDLILVRCSGHDLEKTGIIAGMSGSPIYFDGRLAGALSYAWTFGKEPIAGVTPIASMLDDMKRSSSPASGTTGLRRLSSPLLVSGFTPTLLEALKKRVGSLGLVPVLGSGSAQPGPVPPARPVPGGAIGVELIRGDWNASAVGTITHVDGDRVLAFGHPLFGLGPVAVPATGATVHTIFSSSYLSFKFASPLGSLGSLVEDRQSCIVVRRGEEPRMVPVKLRTRNVRTGRNQVFALEVVDNAKLTPSLVLESAANALDAAEATSDDLTAEVRLRARLRDGRELELSDRFDNGRNGPFNLASFAPFLELPDNSYAPAFLASIEADLELLPGRATAEILDAYPSVRQARAGETFLVQVAVKPYGKPAQTLGVPVVMPAGAPEGLVRVDIDGGAAIAPDLARPEDLDGLLKYVQARNRATDLVVSVEEPGRVLDHRGFHISRAPGSLRAVMGSEGQIARTRVKVPTEWILSGLASTSVELKRQVVAK